MSHDIISVLMFHHTLKYYRPEGLIQTTGIQKKQDRKFTETIQDIPCRIFDIDSDKLKTYREMGIYEPGMMTLLSKYPFQPEDILVIRDEVRMNVFYIKQAKHLSLEPLVSLFKCYSYLAIPYTGEITLMDLTKKRFPRSFYGIDEEFA